MISLATRDGGNGAYAILYRPAGSGSSAGTTECL